MNRSGLVIVLAMGVLTLLLWWLVNRPGIEPPWPAQIAGVSFSGSDHREVSIDRRDRR